jgi:toxin ParE1/3/4
MGHRIAPEAESDLEQIWDYIARESGSIEIADRLIDSLTQRFYLLSIHPYLGRRRDEELRPGIRSFPVGDYLVLYRVEGSDVLVLRVLHGRRDIERLFGN